MNFTALLPRALAPMNEGTLVWLALSLAACGTTTANDTTSTPACPTVGVEGSSCSAPECEYAGSTPYCTRLLTCNGGKLLGVTTRACPSNDATCAPALSGIKVGSSCGAAALCDYVDGRCGCMSPLGGAVQVDGGLSWQCASAPSSCPQLKPLAGTPCTRADQTCDYGACAFGGNPYAGPMALKCTGGLWTRTEVLCPQ